MRHVNIVANLMGHSRSRKVGLIHVQVHRDASSLGCTHTVWDTHTRLSALKLFSAATQQMDIVSNKQSHTYTHTHTHTQTHTKMVA